MLILFNKPYGVLSQFTDTVGRATLADYVPVANVYPAGRLDRDSEGLLLLTDDGKTQQRLSDPRFKQPKTYWVQVEGEPDAASLDRLRRGIELEGTLTAPALVEQMPEPDLWPRQPPIRVRKSIPTSWLRMTITEGRNRQVRRMTAAAGYPTLRLVRYSVGSHTIQNLRPGEWRKAEANTSR